MQRERQIFVGTTMTDSVFVGDKVNEAFKDKRVTVVGLARSGIAAANALDTLGARVTVTDRKRTSELSSQIAALGSNRIHVVAGEHPESLFTEADLVVLSPGVPKLPQITAARKRGVKVIGELELGWLLSNSPFIGITGTNGKSTVTTLVGHMLERAGKKAYTAGNIGTALTERPAMLRDQDWIVAEISSFQLEEIETFRPRIAAILNLTQDHLDRYHDLKEYGDAKARIFENQTTDDVLVLNYDDPLVRAMAEHAMARVLPFSRIAGIEEGVTAAHGRLTYRGDTICRVEEIQLQGIHNLENVLAAAGTALTAGADRDSVAAVLREFSGLEHRLEFVREKNGVRYVNDSKGTNVGAVAKSVAGFMQPLILIAGGLDKGSDFGPLYELVRQKVKLLILIGKAAATMEDALRGATETVRTQTLQDAVLLASEQAVPGDVVLLSPACASFDMFKDFEERGRQFKEAVTRL